MTRKLGPAMSCILGLLLVSGTAFADNVTVAGFTVTNLEPADKTVYTVGEGYTQNVIEKCTVSVTFENAFEDNQAIPVVHMTSYLAVVPTGGGLAGAEFRYWDVEFINHWIHQVTKQVTNTRLSVGQEPAVYSWHGRVTYEQEFGGEAQGELPNSTWSAPTWKYQVKHEGDPGAFDPSFIQKDRRDYLVWRDRR